MKTLASVHVSEQGVKLNGETLYAAGTTLNQIYRQSIGDYPKFFKMDALCKLGFIGAELLLKDMPLSEKENGAVILFNRNGSLITDRNYQATIQDADNYFPSPTLFVYTLANIVTGEIAIRHKIYGETQFYILEGRNLAEMNAIVESAFLTSHPSFILTGWVDYENEDNFTAEMKLVTNQ